MQGPLKVDAGKIYIYIYIHTYIIITIMSDYDYYYYYYYYYHYYYIYMSSLDDLQYLSTYIRTRRDSTNLSSFYHRLLAEGFLGSVISSYELQSTLLQGNYIGDHTRSIIGAIESHTRSVDYSSYSIRRV